MSRFKLFVLAIVALGLVPIAWSNRDEHGLHLQKREWCELANDAKTPAPTAEDKRRLGLLYDPNKKPVNMTDEDLHEKIRVNRTGWALAMYHKYIEPVEQKYGLDKNQQYISPLGMFQVGITPLDTTTFLRFSAELETFAKKYAAGKKTGEFLIPIPGIDAYSFVDGYAKLELEKIGFNMSSFLPLNEPYRQQWPGGQLISRYIYSRFQVMKGPYNWDGENDWGWNIDHKWGWRTYSFKEYPYDGDKEQNHYQKMSRRDTSRETLAFLQVLVSAPDLLKNLAIYEGPNPYAEYNFENWLAFNIFHEKERELTRINVRYMSNPLHRALNHPNPKLTYVIFQEN